MIRPITEQILRPLLESQLTWMSLFGGIAVSVTKTVNADGDTITYPVSVKKPKDCPPSREPILAPDTNQTAILWLEEASNVVATDMENIAKRQGRLYTQSFRLLGWVNGPGLGEDGWQYAYSPEQHVINVLDGLRYNNYQLQNIGLSSDIPINQLTVRVTGMQEKDIDTIFGEYSFSEEPKYLVQPYDYFAIDLELEWRIIGSCLPAFDPEEPLDCPPNGIADYA